MSMHVVPLRVYLSVFVALMVLLVLTVLVAFLHLGAFAPLAMMTIAVAKAVVIILWFMHVRYSSRLTQVFVGGAFVWLALLIIFTMSDVLSREMVGGGSPW
jgi:cytochrome c oxidase subunit 4